MSEPMPISAQEKAGIIEMRQILAALRKRGDEHFILGWVWHGEKFKQVTIEKFGRLIET